MLKFEIHADDIGHRDWHREGAGWVCGKSWIRPLVSPVLESALDISTSGTCLVTVRERDAEGPRMALTVANMRKWPGDHVTLELAQDRVVVHAGVMGTAPLHIAARNGVFVGSWNLADLRPWFDSSSLNGPSVVRALLRNPVYASTTMFDGVHRVTERATATITSAGIQVAYPDPAEHVLAARDLADDVDAVGAFEKVLTYVVQRLPDPGGAVAVELSGGADSANVLLTAAERHQELRTVGIEVSGRAGQEQRHRRRALAAHVGAADMAVHAGDHLPFDPAIRKQPHSPATAYYREAFDAMRDLVHAVSAGVVYLGLGGDEVNALHPGERIAASPAGTYGHLPPPSWLGPRAWGTLGDLEADAAPVSVVPLPTLDAFALHNPTYLDAGIWPIAPLAHPLVGRFAEQLPAAHRRGKRMFRERLARAGMTRRVTHPGEPESFVDLMERGMRTNGLLALKQIRSESLLAEEGWINHAGLVDAIDRYESTGQADPRLADLVTVELGLRSLQ
ncbi:asparagine synthase-related protein [Nocardioides sp. NPDC051685]|uniref:asparagine synthase-related protein n=1 Tax=Nocardioides sp. NPDC051685 TaxID=3364334 RepID=UPI0037BC32F3